MNNNTDRPTEPDLSITTQGEYELANRWSRLWAALIDALTIVPVIFILMYFTGGFSDIQEGVEPSFIYDLTLLVISLIIFLAIHGKLMVSDGQTYGKKILKIKMVTMENQAVDMSNLSKRYGFYWFTYLVPVVGSIISLINVLFIFTESKRCLHDHVGETKVVNVK